MSIEKALIFTMIFGAVFLVVSFGVWLIKDDKKSANKTSDNN